MRERFDSIRANNSRLFIGVLNAPFTVEFEDESVTLSVAGLAHEAAVIGDPDLYGYDARGRAADSPLNTYETKTISSLPLGLARVVVGRSGGSLENVAIHDNSGGNQVDDLYFSVVGLQMPNARLRYGKLSTRELTEIALVQGKRLTEAGAEISELTREFCQAYVPEKEPEYQPKKIIVGNTL